MSTPMTCAADALSEAAGRAAAYRARVSEISPWPKASLAELRAGFDRNVPERGKDAVAVIRQLADVAEPGLAGTPSPAFHGWVMGGSHTLGVAAEWLASAWGQNAAMYQCSPAAAVAEEAAASCLLELLDLPREASIGFTTGATMASFVGLSAARLAVLEQAGWNLEEGGLFGAPKITVYLGAEAHTSVLHALRLLGFGRSQLAVVAADRQGRLDPERLAREMAARDGPAIVVGQAGHINSGAFDDFPRISEIARAHKAWMHIDGAFGLWARASARFRHLAEGAELADSCAIDGHKWLQVPYDCGYAILRDPGIHRRAMALNASYLTRDSEDGRNPCDYVPELSRRARGFSTWAVIQALGRKGVEEIVDRSCANAALFAACCGDVPEIEVLNDIVLNQVCLASSHRDNEDRLIARIQQALAEDGRWFAKSARWQDRPVLRFSFCSAPATTGQIEEMAATIAHSFAREAALSGANRSEATLVSGHRCAA